MQRDAISVDGPGIDWLKASADRVPSSLDELVEEGDPAATRAFLDRYPRRVGAYLQRLRQHLAAKGLEYHQFKYAVALEDETSASDPRWTSRLLAPAAGYLPTRKAEDNRLTARSLHALRRARVL